MTNPDHARAGRAAIVAQGVAATAVITAGGAAALGVVSLWRCGGFFGESAAVPGTLSEQLCRASTGRVVLAIAVLAPVLCGLAGTARAAAARDGRRMRLLLLAAASVPAAIAALYLVSGSI